MKGQSRVVVFTQDLPQIMMENWKRKREGENILRSIGWEPEDVAVAYRIDKKALEIGLEQKLRL